MPENEGDANENRLPALRPQPLRRASLSQMGGLVVRATEEEQQKPRYLSDRHRSGVKELQELLEQRKELRKLHDEFLFQRRCVAACFANRIVVRDLGEAYVRHQRRIGLKLRDLLPEELMP